MRRSLVGLACVLAMAGCHTKAPIASPDDDAKKSGAELWSESCKRCHRMRDPADLDRAGWKIVMLHMRVRANLTGEEAREILAFLASGR